MPHIISIVKHFLKFPWYLCNIASVKAQTMPRYVVCDHPISAGQCVVFDTHIGENVLIPGTGNVPKDDFLPPLVARALAEQLNRIYDMLHSARING